MWEYHNDEDKSEVEVDWVLSEVLLLVVEDEDVALDKYDNVESNWEGEKLLVEKVSLLLHSQLRRVDEEGVDTVASRKGVSHEEAVKLLLIMLSIFVSMDLLVVFSDSLEGLTFRDYSSVSFEADRD